MGNNAKKKERNRNTNIKKSRIINSHKQKERERERERERDRQTDRQTDRNEEGVQRIRENQKETEGEIA